MKPKPGGTQHLTVNTIEATMTLVNQILALIPNEATKSYLNESQIPISIIIQNCPTPKLLTVHNSTNLKHKFILQAITAISIEEQSPFFNQSP